MSMCYRLSSDYFLSVFHGFQVYGHWKVTFCLTTLRSKLCVCVRAACVCVCVCVCVRACVCL